ncbi:MAG TPA: cyclodeaminase/cyclohydrolase family protein [Vicinamibacterales bacterium]|nr:cyclodeaminase/cyclohydrolase family protein [Vicinamibacterales bacterium]
MARFADHSISAFLDAVASPDPTPGGGTAAAVGGAIGVSLLMMVSGLSRTRGSTDEERARLGETRASLAGVRDRLLTLADTDTEAYNQVMAAYRLPKGTEEEKAARKRAVQDAMRAATAAPLDILRAVAEAMTQAKVVAELGNPSAASDVRVALELLEAAGAGAAANVEINLTALDGGFRKASSSTMIELSNQLTEHSAAARSAFTPAQ